jgi:hypothetical protein
MQLHRKHEGDFTSLPLWSKPTKPENESCTFSRDPINGVFTKFQSPCLIVHEFSNMMMENPIQHDYGQQFLGLPSQKRLILVGNQ